jgi:hypothetical protein
VRGWEGDTAASKGPLSFLCPLGSLLVCPLPAAQGFPAKGAPVSWMLPSTKTNKLQGDIKIERGPFRWMGRFVGFLRGRYPMCPLGGRGPHDLRLHPPGAKPAARAPAPGAAQAGQGGLLRPGARAEARRGADQVRHAAPRVAGIISGASGAGFVKQGDPIAVREMSTNAAALSPRKLRFDSPFSRASFSSPAGALARSGGECPKTRTNLDSAAAAVEKILSFRSFFSRKRPILMGFKRETSLAGCTPICRKTCARGLPR